MWQARSTFHGLCRFTARVFGEGMDCRVDEVGEELEGALGAIMKPMTARRKLQFPAKRFLTV